MAKRRLIGPTLLSLILCGLWTDNVFFSDSPWSPGRFLSKVALGSGAIFGPVFNPAFYAWASDLTLPVLLIIAALVFLVLTSARAKTAMNNATREADTVPHEAAPRLATISKTISSSEETKSAQPSVKRQYGLLAKLASSFSAVSVLLAA